jgi:hypothetical protein
MTWDFIDHLDPMHGEGAVRGSSPASVEPASEGTRAKLM